MTTAEALARVREAGLFATADSLEAEIERLTKERDEWKATAAERADVAHKHYHAALGHLAEVERLTEERDNVQGMANLAHAEVSRLQAENERLREECEKSGRLAAYVSGVLCDAATIPVAETDDVAGLHKGLRAMLAELERLRAAQSIHGPATWRYTSGGSARPTLGGVSRDELYRPLEEK